MICCCQFIDVSIDFIISRSLRLFFSKVAFTLVFTLTCYFSNVYGHIVSIPFPYGYLRVHIGIPDFRKMYWLSLFEGGYPSFPLIPLVPHIQICITRFLSDSCLSNSLSYHVSLCMWLQSLQSLEKYFSYRKFFQKAFNMKSDG